MGVIKSTSDLQNRDSSKIACRAVGCLPHSMGSWFFIGRLQSEPMSFQFG